MPFIRNDYWIRVADLENTDEHNRLPLPPLTFPVLVGSVEKNVILEVDVAEFRIREGDEGGKVSKKKQKEQWWRRRAEEEEEGERRRQKSPSAEKTGEEEKGEPSAKRAKTGEKGEPSAKRTKTGEEGEPSAKRMKTGEEEEEEEEGTVGKRVFFFAVYAWFRLGDARITVSECGFHALLAASGVPAAPPDGAFFNVDDDLYVWRLPYRHREGFNCGDARDPFPRCLLRRRGFRTSNGLRHFRNALHHSRRYLRLRVQGWLEIPQRVGDSLFSRYNSFINPLADAYPALPSQKPRSLTLAEAMFARVESAEAREGANFLIRCEDVETGVDGREVVTVHEFYASREPFLLLDTAGYFQVNTVIITLVMTNSSIASHSSLFFRRFSRAGSGRWGRRSSGRPSTPPP